MQHCKVIYQSARWSKPSDTLIHIERFWREFCFFLFFCIEIGRKTINMLVYMQTCVNLKTIASNFRVCNLQFFDDVNFGSSKFISDMHEKRNPVKEFRFFLPMFFFVCSFFLLCHPKIYCNQCKFIGILFLSSKLSNFARQKAETSFCKCFHSITTCLMIIQCIEANRTPIQDSWSLTLYLSASVSITYVMSRYIFFHLIIN